MILSKIRLLWNVFLIVILIIDFLFLFFFNWFVCTVNVCLIIKIKILKTNCKGNEDSFTLIALNHFYEVWYFGLLNKAERAIYTRKKYVFP